MSALPQTRDFVGYDRDRQAQPYDLSSKDAVRCRDLKIDQVKTMIKARSHRADYFRSDLFADPAWDILLELACAELTGQRISTSSLCIAAAVPATTALRWIRALTEEGLLAKRKDPLDARRVFVALTVSAASSMREYLDSERS